MITSSSHNDNMTESFGTNNIIMGTLTQISQCERGMTCDYWTGSSTCILWALMGLVWGQCAPALQTEAMVHVLALPAQGI